ncbi:MAG: hypothetical protein OEY89_02355 [Gammaproteobacteria bacterium]|nr:hypothetical protein [Gammaproteobacteria bacterium]
MPIKNTINQEEKIIYSICEGLMVREDFDLYVSRIWSHYKYYGFNELFDTVQGDWSEFDFGYLFSVAETAAKLKTIDTNSKLAWVVLEGKQKELTDFYRSAKLLLPVKSRSLEAFYLYDEAMQWLKA